MMQPNNEIEAVYEANNIDYFKSLQASEAYLSIFGDMSFDETMLEEDREDLLF